MNSGKKFLGRVVYLIDNCSLIWDRSFLSGIRTEVCGTN